ncbi:MAG TPA: OB-fold domain-containing protein [Novosphingobium sp.]
MSYDALPVPDPDIASARFFAALDAGRLDVQRCAKCGTPHLAVITCDACGGDQFVSETATGKATIYSFARTHNAHHPAFADLMPFTGGIVELAEGPRLFAPLLGPGPFRIGQAVSADLLEVQARRVAAFRLVDSAG